MRFPGRMQIHWRLLWVSLIVYVAVLMVSHFDISIRHFTIPLALLILLLAPLPRLAQRTRPLAVLTAALAAGCLFTAVRAYPSYMPYFNALRMGRPAYQLATDSNVDWNQALPEARQFLERHGQQTVELDEYGYGRSGRHLPAEPEFGIARLQRRPTPRNGCWSPRI